MSEQRSHAEKSPVVLVTGGEGGLGCAVTAAFRDQGVEVHAPGRGEFDVTDAESVAGFIGRLGRVDVLVNNAGVTADKPLLRMTEDDWQRVIDVNLSGSMRCAQAVVRGMVKRRAGVIINVASYSAINPPLGQANYAAAKAGLIGFTKSLAKELGSRNVRVNAVLPGFLATKMTAGLSDEVVAGVMGDHALGRLNTVDEAARFIAFLATMENVSGQVFQLDSRSSSW